MLSKHNPKIVFKKFDCAFHFASTRVAGFNKRRISLRRNASASSTSLAPLRNSTTYTAATSGAFNSPFIALFSPQGTYSLLDSTKYGASDDIYHPICALISESATFWMRTLRGQTRVERGPPPSLHSFPENVNTHTHWFHTKTQKVGA